jgi:acetyltransferase EpsM
MRCNKAEFLSLNKPSPVAIIGAGGHSLIIISLLTELNYPIVGIFDDDESKYGNSILGIPVLGKPEDIPSHNCWSAVVAIGSNRIRRVMVNRLPDLEWVTLIHPNAYVHSSVKVGQGTVVMLDAVVRVCACVGSHTIINTKAVVGHGCEIGDYAHIAGSSHIGGDSVVGEGAMLGLGAAIIPERKVGAWSVVGAGAVVTRDIPDGVRAMGVPAVVK